MLIRLATLRDLPAILALERKNPSAARWDEAAYRRVVEDANGVLLVAEADAPPWILGFVAAERVLDEGEVRNLAVDPGHQRQGMGRALLAEAHRVLRKGGLLLLETVNARTATAFRNPAASNGGRQSSTACRMYGRHSSGTSRPM